MFIANLGNVGGERRAGRRRLGVCCVLGIVSMTALSCLESATDTRTPDVDYKTLTPNAAFVANHPAQAHSSAAPSDGMSASPMSSGDGAPMGGVMPPSAAGPSAPSLAGSTGAKPNAGAPATPPSAGVAGTMAVSAIAGAPGAAATGGPVAGAPAMQPPATRPTVLTLDFMTKTQKGRYAPKNVGVAWVETLAGKWIHTLYYWAGMPNDSHLTRYNAAGGPNYATRGELARVLGLPPYTTQPPADVVAGPTLDMHKMHSGAMWNLKTMQGMEVPDGDYRVVIELTEVDSTGKSQEIAFTKGAMPFEISMDYDFYPAVKLTLK